jgi:hypothetical protein
MEGKMLEKKKSLLVFLSDQCDPKPESIDYNLACACADLDWRTGIFVAQWKDVSHAHCLDLLDAISRRLCGENDVADILQMEFASKGNGFERINAVVFFSREEIEDDEYLRQYFAV